MIVQIIAERLRSQLNAPVFGAAEFYDAQENTAYTKSPTVFIIPASQRATAYTEDDQYFDIASTVDIIVMREVECQDARKEAALYDAQGDRTKLFKALLDWRPSELHRPTQFVSGTLLQSRNKRIFYSYSFTFTEQISLTCDGIQDQAEWDNEQLFNPQYKVSTC